MKKWVTITDDCLDICDCLSDIVKINFGVQTFTSNNVPHTLEFIDLMHKYIYVAITDFRFPDGRTGDDIVVQAKNYDIFTVVYSGKKRDTLADANLVKPANYSDLVAILGRYIQ